MDGRLPQHAVGVFVLPVLVGVLASKMCHLSVSWISWPGCWCCGTCDGQCHLLCSPKPTSLFFKVVCGCGLHFNPGVGGLTDMYSIHVATFVGDAVCTW